MPFYDSVVEEDSIYLIVYKEVFNQKVAKSKFTQEVIINNKYSYLSIFPFKIVSITLKKGNCKFLAYTSKYIFVYISKSAF